MFSVAGVNGGGDDGGVGVTKELSSPSALLYIKRQESEGKGYQRQRNERIVPTTLFQQIQSDQQTGSDKDTGRGRQGPERGQHGRAFICELRHGQ